MSLSALVALVDIKTSQAGSEKNTQVIETERKGKKRKRKKRQGQNRRK